MQQSYAELVGTQAALVATQAELGRKEADLVALRQQLGQAQQRAQHLQQQLNNQAVQLQDARVRGGVCRPHGHCLLSMRPTNRHARWFTPDLHSPCLFVAVAAFLALLRAQAAQQAAELSAFITSMELTCTKDRLAEVGVSEPKRACLYVCSSALAACGS